MWESRNAVQHSEENTQNQREQCRIQQKICKAYGQSTMDFPADAQYLFGNP
jgi:hypothetical protein